MSTAGVYTISLVTSNASGTATTTKTLTVGNCPPAVNFTVPASIRFCDVKTFSTTNQTSNPPGTSGSISYTWTVAPNVGLQFFPNRFQQNMSVTISDPTIMAYTVTLTGKNASGTSTTNAVISIDMCTDGIAEGSLNKGLDVYPNPVRDQLNLTLPTGDSYTVKITNLLGTVVYSENVNKEKVSINLANTARGVYFVTVESKTEKVTRKVILD
jgi:PKD repeat protein